MDKREEILEAFKQGKTIQARKGKEEEWHDFIPQNQLDRPNINYGNWDNWRIKPDGGHIPLDTVDRMSTTIHKERIGIPFPSQQKAKENKEKSYNRDQMLLFAGFCMGKKMTNPGMDVGEILAEFDATFSNG